MSEQEIEFALRLPAGAHMPALVGPADKLRVALLRPTAFVAFHWGETGEELPPIAGKVRGPGSIVYGHPAHLKDEQKQAWEVLKTTVLTRLCEANGKKCMIIQDGEFPDVFRPFEATKTQCNLALHAAVEIVHELDDLLTLMGFELLMESSHKHGQIVTQGVAFPTD